MKNKLLSGLVASAALFSLSACYQVPQSTAASYEDGTIGASDQPAGSTLVVETVGMPSTGWVVVHAVEGGQPVLGSSIGHVYVPAGPSSNVAVPLDAALPAGAQAVAMLHLDTGNAKVFEYGNGSVQPLDGPVLVDGKPVMAMVTLR